MGPGHPLYEHMKTARAAAMASMEADYERRKGPPVERIMQYDMVTTMCAFGEGYAAGYELGKAEVLDAIAHELAIAKRKKAAK